MSWEQGLGPEFPKFGTNRLNGSHNNGCTPPFVLQWPFTGLAFISALLQGQYVILIRTAVMTDVVSLNRQLTNTMESANAN